MQVKNETVQIDTIGAGALKELFAAELKRILDNIADINTDPKAKRTINIALIFKPNLDRDRAEVELKCSTKLAGLLPASTNVFIGRIGGVGPLVAIDNDPKQIKLFEQKQPQMVASNVTPISQPTNKDGE